MVFKLPVSLLTPGVHELHISMKNNSAKVILYPDIVEPYYYPYYGDEIKVADETFSVEPTIGHLALEALREVL